MSMATRTTSSTGVLAVSTSERERVFDAFRQWGYLEADLDPLGFLRPESRSELQIDGEAARDARRIYSGTVGAEFMHISDLERRAWIQEHMEAPPYTVDHEHLLEQLISAEI